MESAGTASQSETMEERLQRRESIIQALSTAMERVMNTMDRWERGDLPTPPPTTLPPITQSTPSPPGPSGIRLSLPRAYDGTPAGCQGFLLQVELYLATIHPAPSGYESVSALIFCLSGKALEWANAEWGGIYATSVRYEDFTRRFRAVFDHPPEGRAAGERLFHLRQERRSAQDFALEFRTLAASAGWNERALIDQYRCSLREDVQRELACRDTNLNLDQLVEMSIRLDNLLETRGRSDQGPFIPSPSTSDSTPMEVLGDGMNGPSPAPTAAAEDTLRVSAGEGLRELRQ
ncbi:hypothetical protein J4Q44_G00161090 [Coregonus suidteri]|uniref:Retrotransposon gag domain-containing protein n=1 Tax=Coregonus suidteri TaxID=861788 RepID=A0AAN8LQU1_9TELE